MSTKVTRVTSDSDDPEWQITVTRNPPLTHRAGPPVADVPADVRAALLEWLDPSSALVGTLRTNDRLRRALLEIADSAGVPDVDRSGMARAALEVTR